MTAVSTSVPTAFLSHASADKAFVDVVAQQLGRQRVQYDKWVFEGGVGFLEAIRSTVARSSLFVLFASRQSLESLWVKFELAEAEEALRSEALKGALVVIIDPVIRHTDLPKWMQRALVEIASNPKATARLIQHHLDRARGLDPNSLFIGRDAVLAEISEKLIPAPEADPPRLLVLGGLSGIGRRTVLSRALRDFLSLRNGPAIHLKPTDGLDALHIKLLDELGSLDTREDLAAAIDSFQRATPTERAATISRLLASAAVGNVAPIIVDDGALIDSSGHYTQEAAAVLQEVRAFPECFLAIIHTKRPEDDARLKSLNGVFARVPPLDLSATRLLLTQLLRRHGVTATTNQIAELAPYLDGYPPAINLAASLAKQYGLSVILADKSGLVNFKIRTFAGVLEGLGLSSRQWAILRVLAAGVALSMSTLTSITSCSEEELAKELRDLIDLNLVLVWDDFYTIASPVRTAVQAIAGALVAKDFTFLAKTLKAQFWDGNERLPPIDIIEATIHAVMRSDSPDLSEFRGLVLPSVLYRVAKELYDRGGVDAWERAQPYINELLRLDPAHRLGLVLKAKTHVRLSQWNSATETIAEVQQRGMAEHDYLMGFMFWKSREYVKAISRFRAALNAGQESLEIYHGLASCLMRINEFKQAETVIKKALRGRRPNSLLLDLAAQIAIIQQQFEEAEDYIDQLQRVRAFDDYNFRLATLKNARHQFQDALPLLENAIRGPRRRFEVEATMVDTLIELRDFRRASDLLEELDQRRRSGRDKASVRLGLRCKLYLRQRRWQDAEQIWDRIEDKATPVHVGLRAEILSQKIEDLRTSPGQRVRAQAELSSIEGAGTKASSPVYALPDADSDADGTPDTDHE